MAATGLDRLESRVGIRGGAVKAIAKGPIFYVYEHWRPDTDMCFWVGKGHGKRAHKLKRNHYYNNVVKKLAKNGMCIEVRMVSSGLSEGDAFSLEKERISFWRSQGKKLAN